MLNMNVFVLPILIPLVFVIAAIVIQKQSTSRLLGGVGTALLFIVSVYLLLAVKEKGITVIYMGGWKAPFGITLVFDMFSAIMVMVSALIALCISIYSYKQIDSAYINHKFYIFFFSLLIGVNGALTTGDIFNLYVWFELILISSFVLLTMGGKKEQLEGGIKYMAMNLLGSLLFLAGLGLLYGKTGTLNMAHLSSLLTNDGNSLLMNTSAVLFFVAFGLKAAVFPLFFWLPASYHTANNAITSLFAGLLTKVGVYVLFRCFTLFFVQDQVFWNNLVLIIAALTMVIGGMAAAIYYDSRRILSYHIISQIGYMILGLGISTPLAIAGAIYFIIHNMIAKTNVFLIAGLIASKTGNFNLKESGSLFNTAPFLAILFLIPAFALAGVPPISGFFAKFVLIKGGIDAGNYIVSIVAVFTGLLTLYSMIKIWFEAFLKNKKQEAENIAEYRFSISEYLPSIFLGLASILLGVFASEVIDWCMLAADDLVYPQKYVDAVLTK